MFSWDLLANAVVAGLLLGGFYAAVSLGISLIFGLLDIAKPRGDVFLDRLDERLTERGIAVKRYKKPTNARTAPLPLQQQIATEVNLVIEGLSD